MHSEISQNTLEKVTSVSTHSQLLPQTSDPDEINLLEYIYVLVKHKWLIIGATVIGMVAGYIAAVAKGPTFTAEAVIAPKESESQKTPNLSAFGAFSGIVASQMNMSANPGLDKIEQILSSRKFSADLIQKYDLLPVIYKVKWPKVYKEMYDTNANAWSKKFVEPKILGMGEFLKETYLKKETKSNLMTLKVESTDSTFSDSLLAKYLVFLNYHIQTSVQQDAKENVAFLENQLIVTTDPLLREKLQTMIAAEVEKTMLVSKEAFRIVDPQLSSVQYKEKKLYPMVFGVGLFFLTTMIVVFGHAFASGDKTEEDKKLIEGIKREIKRI